MVHFKDFNAIHLTIIDLLEALRDFKFMVFKPKYLELKLIIGLAMHLIIKIIKIQSITKKELMET